MLGFTVREWLRAFLAAIVFVVVGYPLLVMALVAGGAR